MKNFLILFIALILSLKAVDIPKSSLEHVKLEILSKLKQAKIKHDTIEITKYQNELNEVEKKIKKFEFEWLNHKKRQLQIKPSSTEIQQKISEIDEQLKAYTA